MAKLKEHKVILLTALIGVIGVWGLINERLYDLAVTLVAGIVATVWTVTNPPRKVSTQVASVLLIDAIVICSAWISPDTSVESMVFGLVAASFISVRVYPKVGLLAFVCMVVFSAVPLYREARGFSLLFNLAVLGAACVLMLQVTEVALKLREYRKLSIFDDLTELHNVRYFRFKVASYFRDPKVSQVCLCILDLDRFKEVNDLLGHREGDHVLQRVAREVERAAHPVVVSRYGGEEFVIAMPNTSTDVGAELAEKIRLHIAGANVCPIRVTMSCGVAAVQTAVGTQDMLFDAADKALYVAKQARNCVRVFSADVDREVLIEAASSGETNP